MNAGLRDAGGAGLSEAQQRALVKLLDDDDPAVLGPVRGRILACGREAAGWLRPYMETTGGVVRERVQELLEHFDRQDEDSAFLAFCLSQGEDLDLETAVWKLARTRYPGLDPAAYGAVLDSHADVLRGGVREGESARECLERLNAHLFEDLGYAGNASDYYDPQNSYLNRVLDRRTGNPISMCAVYLFVARRLQLPVVGVGMPGHFLCRYQSSREEIYIDPFHGGRLLTKAHCMQHLARSSFGYQEGFLSPVTPRRMLVRMCANLHQIHLHLKDRAEASRFQRYLVALAK